MANKEKLITRLLFKWNRIENRRVFFWRTKKFNLFQFIMVELLLQKTRAETAENTIKIFTSKYKNANTILKTKKQVLKKDIKPLGLQNQRFKAILKIAKYFKENKKNIEIENLFGVGHYICNAVKCFYYNEKVSILDINTSRIISRLFNVANNIDLRKNIRLRTKAMSFLPSKNYKKFNWILLDFGSQVCKAKPLCPKCPLKGNCSYYTKTFSRN